MNEKWDDLLAALQKYSKSDAEWESAFDEAFDMVVEHAMYQDGEERDALYDWLQEGANWWNEEGVTPQSLAQEWDETCGDPPGDGWYVAVITAWADSPTWFVGPFESYEAAEKAVKDALGDPEGAVYRTAGKVPRDADLRAVVMVDGTYIEREARIGGLRGEVFGDLRPRKWNHIEGQRIPRNAGELPDD